MCSVGTDNVQGLLKLFLCFVLLARVSSLQCEICESNATSCTGPNRNCTADSDACIITISKNTLGGNTRFESQKQCGSSKVCTKPVIHFEVEEGRSFISKDYCCKQGENCSKITPTLPTLQKNPEKKKCPSCNLKEDCDKKKTVECSGTDIRCYTLTLLFAADGKSVENIMKGCGSKHFCTYLGTSSKLTEDKIRTLVKCTFSGASQVLGSLLTTFSSLWILKLLV